MGWIRNALNTAEKTITRKVIESKVESIIKSVNEVIDTVNTNSDAVNDRVKDSSNDIAEILTLIMNTFNTGFKGFNTTLKKSINNTDNKIIITDFITRNKDDILTIINTVKNLNSPQNQIQGKAIIKAVKSDISNYAKEFSDKLDEEYEENVKPLTINIGEIWGKTHTFQIFNQDGDLIYVTEDAYLTAKSLSSDWCCTKTLWSTYQITKEQFENHKKHAKQQQ